MGNKEHHYQQHEQCTLIINMVHNGFTWNWIYQHGPHVHLLPCVHYSWSSGCHPGPPITFDIPLVSAASRVRTAVDTTIIRQQQTLIGETQIIMIIIPYVTISYTVRLKLKATQRLQADYTLIINRTWLCLASKDIRSTVGDGCLDTNQTKKSINIVVMVMVSVYTNSNILYPIE